MKALGNLIVLFFLALPVRAHEVTAGALEIIHPSIQPTAPNAMSAAGYMAVSNNGDQPDRLVAIEAGIARQASLHTTEIGADGVARMMQLDGLDIPAGETVVLETGGMHVMFMGLAHGVAKGEMVPATLVFERAGRVEVEFSADPAEGAMDHSTHGGTAGEGAEQNGN